MITVHNLDKLDEETRQDLLRYVELRQKQMTLQEIADEMYVCSATVSNLKRRMKAKGYLVEPRLRSGKPPKPKPKERSIYLEERAAVRRERYYQYVCLKERDPDLSITAIARMMGISPQLIHKTIKLQKEEEKRENS